MSDWLKYTSNQIKNIPITCQFIRNHSPDFCYYILIYSQNMHEMQKQLAQCCPN